MPHDFYVVLGISRNADLQQIKLAYRRLVKQFHPDLGGHPPEKFIELQRAYETLKDDEARGEHDRKLVQREPEPETPAIVIRSRRRAPVARRRGGPSLSEEVEGLFSVVDEFFSGWVPGFFTRGRTASRQKDLYVELILDPEEAIAGGLFPLQIPAEVVCKTCSGSGYEGELACPACHGQGRMVTYHEIQVSVPPSVPDGTQKRLSLEDIGLDGVALIVLVTIAT